MNRKTIFFIVLALAAAVAAAVTAWYMTHREQKPDNGDDVEEGVVSIGKDATDDMQYFEDEFPTADPLIVGKWQNADNPQWYKVYYDDYDEEEHLFWGKEWDENDNVEEEDLNYHGNGWFRWEKDDNILREYATMDTRDVPIYHGYRIRLSTADTLVYSETAHKRSLFRFRRVQPF